MREHFKNKEIMRHLLEKRPFLFGRENTEAHDSWFQSENNNDNNADHTALLNILQLLRVTTMIQVNEIDRRRKYRITADHPIKNLHRRKISKTHPPKRGWMMSCSALIQKNPRHETNQGRNQRRTCRSPI